MAAAMQVSPTHSSDTMNIHLEQARAVYDQNSMNSPHILIVDLRRQDGSLADRFLGVQVGERICRCRDGQWMTRADLEQGGNRMVKWYFCDEIQDPKLESTVGQDLTFLNTPLMQMNDETLGSYAATGDSFLSSVVPVMAAREIPMWLSMQDRAELANNLIRARIERGDTSATTWDGTAYTLNRERSTDGLESGCALYASRFLQYLYPNANMRETTAISDLFEGLGLQDPNSSFRTNDPTNGGMIFSLIPGRTSEYSDHMGVTILKNGVWYVYNDHAGLECQPLYARDCPPGVRSFEEEFGVRGFVFARYPGTEYMIMP